MSLLSATLKNDVLRPSLTRSNSQSPNGLPTPPVSAVSIQDEHSVVDGVLELADGSAFRGMSFGAQTKSIAGECVFQTGMSFYNPLHDHCARTRLSNLRCLSNELETRIRYVRFR